MPSPSSRRAWIEIQLLAHKLLRKAVALLAEGVDRNSQDGESEYKGSLSPSPRRAWIEI